MDSRIREKQRREEFEAYYRTAEWKAKRKFILLTVNYKCNCGERATQVHHKTYKRFRNEKFEDLEAVCNSCHRNRHNIK